MRDLPDSEPPLRKTRLPAAPKLPKKKTTAKKETADVDALPRPMWRRYLLWGVIAVLAVALVAEFRAQTSFRKTLSTCSNALEKNEGKNSNDTQRVTFADLKPSLPPDPVYTKEIHSYVPSGVYTWTWQGVRRYKVRIVVNLKDGTVMDVTSEP